MNIYKLLFLISYLIFSTDTVCAEPFHSRNLNPFVQVYGIPAVEAGETTKPGKLAARLQVEMANSYTRSSNLNESIMLDGETYYVTTVFRYGLFDRLEVGLDIPYINHSGGIFDHFIGNTMDFDTSTFRDPPAAILSKASSEDVIYKVVI